MIVANAAPNTPYWNTKINKAHAYTAEEVDYFIFYSPLHNKLLIYKNNGKEYSVVIRFNENTRQKKNVKFAKDFLLSDFLEKNGYNKLYWSE